MPIRIGILTKSDPRKGLWRLAECLIWALEHEPVRRQGSRPAALSLFAVSDYNIVEQDPWSAHADSAQVECKSAVPRGTAFVDWLNGLDILIICERLMPKTFALARRQDVRVVYIPNADWAHLSNSVDCWVSEVRKSGCEVWEKTERTAAALDAVGISCKLVPWSIPDPVSRNRMVRQQTSVTFLVNAGLGGWHNRRGVDTAIKAFALARQKLDNVRLIIKSIKPLADYVPQGLLKTPNIELIEEMSNREDLRMLHDRADAVLYPSRWEGFGLSLLEALHAGVPVIATNGWPMNELVEHRHNGLLVQARKAGTVSLAPHWECHPPALAQEMIQFAQDRDLRQRITCPDPSELISRQYRFILRVRELLLLEAPPRVVLFRSRSEPAWRRSEEYWADALRLHGYTVDCLFFESDLSKIYQALSIPHDFVLVSKVPTQILSSIQPLTDKPIVLWHHDLVYGSVRQDWTQQASALVDLMCVPEYQINQRISGIYSPTLTLLPGAKVDGDRGPGRRPIERVRVDSGADIVFLGNAGGEGCRIPTLRTLSQQFDIQIYGNGWARHDIPANPPVWSADAAAINRQAKITLSISASNTVPQYTSNRLFNSCGAGACVITEAYPGIADHYPPEALAKFRNVEECVDIVRQLLDDDDKRARMRALAEDHTWRNHTWADRISHLLEAVRVLPISRAGQPSTPNSIILDKEDEKSNCNVLQKTDILQAVADMWNLRARQLGLRASGYFGWDEVRFQLETQKWWEHLSPHILTHKQIADRAVLDFGCGCGRFTKRLAQEYIFVVGVDISAEMLHIATKQEVENVKITYIVPGDPLPFASGEFDALWVCIVLQHIPDSVVESIVRELHRVIRKDGFVLLCENTEQTKGRASKSGHLVFRRCEEYLAFFPGIAIVDEFTVAGERHTVFAGHLSF